MCQKWENNWAKKEISTNFFHSKITKKKKLKHTTMKLICIKSSKNYQGTTPKQYTDWRLQQGDHYSTTKTASSTIFRTKTLQMLKHPSKKTQKSHQLFSPCNTRHRHILVQTDLIQICKTYLPHTGQRWPLCAPRYTEKWYRTVIGAVRVAARPAFNCNAKKFFWK